MREIIKHLLNYYTIDLSAAFDVICKSKVIKVFEYHVDIEPLYSFFIESSTFCYWLPLLTRFRFGSKDILHIY